jgi:hypothetical protein
MAERSVRAWAERVLEPATFALALDREKLDETWESSSLPLVFDQSESDRPAAADGVDAAVDSVTSSVLARLRLASIERIVAEVQKQHKSATRGRILAELRAHPRVRVLGRTLVHLPLESR